MLPFNIKSGNERIRLQWSGIKIWSLVLNILTMMASSNENISRVTGHLWEESTGHRWISFRKGQWRAALKCSLICAWTNGWANIRDADDFRYHRDHYDVAVKQRIFHCLPMAAGRDGICSLASAKTALVFATLQDVLLTHSPLVP